MIRLTSSKPGGSEAVIDVRSADFEWSKKKEQNNCLKCSLCLSGVRRSLTWNGENGGVIIICYQHTVKHQRIDGTISVDNISDALIQWSEFGSQGCICWRQQNGGVSIYKRLVNWITLIFLGLLRHLLWAKNVITLLQMVCNMQSVW